MKMTLYYALFLFAVIAVISLLGISMIANAVESTHLVISEIKVTGGSGHSTDEFVELYNPTGASVPLNSWQLVKKTASGNVYVLVDNFGEKAVAAHSFFLIAHPAGYLGEATPDFYYTTTNSVSDNNTVILNNEVQEVVDKVGFGTATDFETAAAANPGANKSLERKARSDSIPELMVEGGAHYFFGNGEDTDNNLSDFIMRDSAEPQNSVSEPEYVELAPLPEPPAPESPQPPPQEPPPAYSKNIIITELFPNPTGSDDGEFIELYNSGDEPVDLSGWKLGDLSARLFTITGEDYKNTIVSARDYFLLEKKVTAISLNNTSDAAKLYSPDSVVVSSVEYANCPEGRSYGLLDGQWLWTDQITPGQPNKLLVKNETPAASFEMEGEVTKVGAPISFDAAGSSDPDADSLTFSWDFGDGTKSSEVKVEHAYQKANKYVVRLAVNDGKGGEDEAEQTIEITDYDYSGQLLLNELLPACQGSDADCEFVELYNPENRSVNLDGWRLTNQKTDYNFSSSAVIKPRGFLTVKRGDSKIALNNTGAKIFLIDPRGKIINGVEYKKAKDDLSFSRLDSRQWQWTEKQTPGKQNEFSLEGDETSSVKEATAGQDDSLTDSSQTASGSNNAVKKEPVDLSSVITSLAQATEDKLGSIIKISAEVESVSGSNIYLVDEEGNTLRVYIQKATGISKPDLKKGDKVEVTGVLDKTDAGLRLLPRKQEDIRVLAEQSAETGKVLGASAEKDIVNVPVKDRSGEAKMYLLIGVILAGVALAVYFVRKKSIKK